MVTASDSQTTRPRPLRKRRRRRHCQPLHHGHRWRRTAATKTLLLQIKDDTTVIAEYYIYNASHAQFRQAAENHGRQGVFGSCSQHPGTGGTLGKVTLTGYTI
jgi:hypothetical protein